MKLCPLLIALVGFAVAVGRPAAAQDQPPSPCRFSVSGVATTQPKITGPEEVTSRAVVLDQPGSPLEITAADFAGTDLRASVGSGAFSVEQSWRVTVRNRSDQPINGFLVEVAVAGVRVAENGTWKSGGWSGAGKTWDGSLMPGGTAVVTPTRGGGSGSGPDENDVRVLLSIERVEFSNCSHRPARVLPK